MKETLPEQIRTVIVDSCNDAGVSLIDVVMRGQARQLILDVFIDAPDGITHDHCRDVSRGIDERLQDHEFAGRLRAVDVSSPGAEAPVKFLWQLQKNTGRTVRVTRTDGSVIEGSLVRADDTGLDVQPKQTKKEPKPLATILAEDVQEAKVLITF
ncbi:MAG: ribosome maturation factor RimP [Ignavibacteria bacterium]|jgi:ribosome maturation factor RimP